VPTRHRRRAAAALLSPLLILSAAACGEGATGDAGASRADLTARADAAQIAVELVHVTDVPGFRLAEQSVGVYGADGFHSVYVAESGTATITLTVDRGAVDEATCACAPDDGAWYRAGDGGHAWLRDSGTAEPYTVTVQADPAAVDRATLRAALDAARPADDAELDAVLPADDTPGVTPERGDLPATGDGAPLDPEGAAG
jgi:catechol 2,3-dioxygenase-like lactoylglutathione lyase family enzyme